jgi:hypothetical protein
MLHLVTARSIRIAALLVTLTTLASGPLAAGAADPVETAEQPQRLAVSFFTAAFLAEVTARIEIERIEAERLTGAYLQEPTGLIWASQDNGKDLDWYAAGAHCSDLELGDWDDWRLPTIDELEGLHDRRSNATYKLPQGIRLTGCCPWSTSRSGETSAWNFSFRYRKRFSGSVNYSYELRALCVREASEADTLFYEQAAEEAKEKQKRR